MDTGGSSSVPGFVDVIKDVVIWPSFRFCNGVKLKSPVGSVRALSLVFLVIRFEWGIFLSSWKNLGNVLEGVSFLEV